jgi:large subunit GTPase 1
MGRTKKQSGNVGRSLVRAKHKKQEKKFSDRHKEDPNDAHDERSAKLSSIIEQNDLQSFLTHATMSNRDFTADRESVTFVVNNETKTYVMNDTGDSLVLQTLSEEEIARRARELRTVVLPIPRRPKWSKKMTKKELDDNEKKSFLKWRRKIAKREEELNATVTPYEKNIEVWRQLWRVIERSHVVVQIVDARNPLLFRSLDLEKYVKQVDENKRNILLINKADLLSDKQRFKWAKYFRSNGIKALFFSAAHEQANINDTQSTREEMLIEQQQALDSYDETQYQDPSDKDWTHIFTRMDLLYYFKSLMNDIVDEKRSEPVPSNVTSDEHKRVVVGLVGYPNVGKSSTVNVLCGKKRVAVGATPGKTKHLQTLPIGKNVLLCDCPGLVFPSVATTKESMVCDGILPIDQLREHRAPIALVCKRIPRRVFELVYGLDFERLRRDQQREDEALRRIQGSFAPERVVERIDDNDSDDNQDDDDDINSKSQVDTNRVTVDQLLNAYARSKGMMSQKGVPNQPMAARAILKDYVNGKLLYCQPPPSTGDQQQEQQEQQQQQQQQQQEEEEGSWDDDEYFTEDDEDDEQEHDEWNIATNDEYAVDEFNVNNVLTEELLRKEEELVNKEEVKRKKRLEKGLTIVPEDQLITLERNQIISKPLQLDQIAGTLTPKQQKRRFANLKKYM